MPNYEILSGNRGLQRGGDLSGQTWKAVTKRGAAHPDPREAKCHAAKEDVEGGTSWVADKEGNDKRDVNVGERG